MHKKGHYGAALTAYAPVGMGALTLGFDVAAVGGGLIAVGLAMLPDVDMNLPNVAHRGPTHTVHFALGVGAVTGVLGGVILAHISLRMHSRRWGSPRLATTDTTHMTSGMLTV